MAPKAMLFLQALHSIQKSAGESGIRRIVHFFAGGAKR
jgi:hypothetical protein